MPIVNRVNLLRFFKAETYLNHEAVKQIRCGLIRYADYRIYDLGLSICK